MINNVNELKQQSGVKYYASLFGKSVIDENSREYTAIKEITQYLLESGIGVMHGGYVGGAMSAINDMATEVISKSNLSPFMHIAVPQKDHDANWERVKDAQFTNTADDIFDRLRMITTSDIAVVLPKGGIGTQLEWTTVFHENQIKEYLKRKVQPLIFFMTPDGTDWKEIVANIIKNLDMKEQSSGSEWVYYVNSIDEFKDLIAKLKANI